MKLCILVFQGCLGLLYMIVCCADTVNDSLIYEGIGQVKNFSLPKVIIVSYFANCNFTVPFMKTAHQRLAAQMENCKFCLDSSELAKHLIIAIGLKVSVYFTVFFINLCTVSNLLNIRFAFQDLVNCLRRCSSLF